jgi:serine/threonine protein kinase
MALARSRHAIIHFQMALTAGTKLGPYEIVAPLGAGGMGEVYRARDTRLNRDVAVKVLPAAFSRDPNRLRRFQHEAQASAALNHPNILAIHDFGQHDGSPYIVSEFLEGETLRERLRSGALPVRKAIDYALQITRGLSAAHEKAIVHRDLKPENVFLTKDGRIKILDFGLAKLTQPETDSESPTVTAQTDPGVVMGTVGYMSPEQVKGQVADHRSDLFSFGAIFYEMLCGRRAFHGETSVETMSAILKEDPPDLCVTNRNLSPALEHFVHHCLEKNREERFQAARDVVYDLEGVSAVSTDSAAVRTRETFRLGKLLIPALAALVTAVAGYLVGRQSETKSAPVFHRLTFQRGQVGRARFSPDGHTVVYSASWEGRPPQIYSTRAEFPEPHSLDLSGYNVLGISPANELAVGSGLFGTETDSDVTLARVPMTGGAPRSVVEHVGDAAWAPDGTLAVVRLLNGRARLEYPVGNALYETTGFINFVRFSPKGDRIAFLNHPAVPDSTGSVEVIDLEGRKQILSKVWDAVAGLAWTPKADEIWFTASPTGTNPSLYAVTPSGHQRLVLSIPGGLLLYDIASDGRVLLGFDNLQAGTTGHRFGDAAERDLSWFDKTIPLDISSDGQWLLLEDVGELAGPNGSEGMRKMDGSPVVRLGEGGGGVFSADGKWATSIVRGQEHQIILLPIGAGQPRRIEIPGIEHLQGSIASTPDGQRHFLSGTERGRGARIYVQSLDGGKAQPITPEGVSDGAPSADGKYVAAQDADGHLAIYPVEGGSPRNVPGVLQNNSIVRWTSDRSSLYVWANTPPAKLYQVNLTSGKAQLVREFIPSDPAGVTSISNVVTSPDGKNYAYGYIRELSTLYVVEGLK